MKIAIVGPTDFSQKGKFPEADAAAEEFVVGMIEALPRYTSIVGGGQAEGVDRWVRHAFDKYKDKRRFHLTEYPPQHHKDKYSDLDWTNRARSIIRDAEKMFVVLPEGYSDMPESELLMLARGSHRQHTIIFLSPRGDASSILEVKAKDTFIPVKAQSAATKEDERVIELPTSRTDSKPRSDVRTKKTKKKLGFRLASGSAPATRKSKPRKKVPVAAHRADPKKRQVRSGQRGLHRDGRKVRSTGKLVFRFGTKGR